MSTEKKYFPPGARVYIDGEDEAIVLQAFPEGSSSFAFPHYKVKVLGLEVCAVSMKRIGIDKVSRAMIFTYGKR